MARLRSADGDPLRYPFQLMEQFTRRWIIVKWHHWNGWNGRRGTGPQTVLVLPPLRPNIRSADVEHTHTHTQFPAYTRGYASVSPWFFYPAVAA